MNSGNHILLFGGTTEGRQMAERLSALGYAVTVCVATRTGADFLQSIPGLRVLTGRKDAAQMAELMGEGYLCCIDATHPYAVEATASIRAACSQTGLNYYRLLRRSVSGDELKAAVSDLIYSESVKLQKNPGAYKPRIHKPGIHQPREYKPGAHKDVGDCAVSVFRVDSTASSSQVVPARRKAPDMIGENESTFPSMITVSSAKEACDLLSACEDNHFLAAGTCNVLLTTGAREAACFSPLLKMDSCKVFIRVLPAVKSLEQCREAGFVPERIISGWGPYSVQDNIRVMEQYGINVLVTKDGGIEGGYPEKLAAAYLCGAKVIVIARPTEEGMSEEEILAKV